MLMSMPMSLSYPREVPRIKRRVSGTSPLAGSYALSSSSRRLSSTREKIDDLLNIEFDNFDTILDEFDKLHDQVIGPVGWNFAVEKPREQVVDVEALLDPTCTLFFYK
ncbi:hypothetical protein ACSQ67_003106 [Phaseolus vulgaris]